MATREITGAIRGTEFIIVVVIREVATIAELKRCIFKQAPHFFADYDSPELELRHTATSSGWLLAESAEYGLVKEGQISDQFQANLMEPVHLVVEVEETLKPLNFPTNNLASGSHPIHVLVWTSSRSKDAKPNVRFDGMDFARAATVKLLIEALTLWRNFWSDFEEKIPTPLLREASRDSGDDKNGDGPPPPPSQAIDFPPPMRTAPAGAPPPIFGTEKKKAKSISGMPPKLTRSRPTQDQARPVKFWEKLRAKFLKAPARSSHRRGALVTIRQFFGTRKSLPPLQAIRQSM